MKLARPRPGPPRKGRPAALAASPCPQRAAMRERGEGAKRLRGGVVSLQRALEAPEPTGADITEVPRWLAQSC